jgi:pimeloyl-ACP methyl ester carboxylesterase
MQIHRQRVDGTDRSYRLSYADWDGPDIAPAVVCVHGLTRNARDFDALAATLSADARVICPDMVGRGGSDALADPAQYDIPAYADHTIQLIDRLGLGQVDWVGTSMGGLIGMAVAAADPGRIRRLVLNDIGPLIPGAAIGRIKRYLGLDLTFVSLFELEAHLRIIHATFGPLTDAQWRQMTEHSGLARADGTWRLHYDPRIREGFLRLPDGDVEYWETWDRIGCPVLVLRGTESDILTAEIAAEMAQRGPGAEVVAFEGIGHAPALVAADQIAVVRDWLRDERESA